MKNISVLKTKNFPTTRKALQRPFLSEMCHTVLLLIRNTKKSVCNRGASFYQIAFNYPGIRLIDLRWNWSWILEKQFWAATKFLHLPKNGWTIRLNKKLNWFTFGFPVDSLSTSTDWKLLFSIFHTYFLINRIEQKAGSQIKYRLVRLILFLFFLKQKFCLSHFFSFEVFGRSWCIWPVVKLFFKSFLVFN